MEPTDPSTHYETVVSLTAPSGLAGVARFRDASGAWSYVLEARPHEMAEELDETLRVFRVGRFASLEEALSVLAADGAWALEQPSEVHPEYREVLLELASRAVAQLPSETAAQEIEIGSMWSAACKSEP